MSIYCEKCGGLIDEKIMFCPICGNKCEGKDMHYQSLEHNEQKRNNMIVAGICIFGVIVIIVALFGWFILANMDKFSSDNGFAVNTMDEIEEVFMENNFNFDVVEYEYLTNVAGHENGNYYLVLCRDSSGYSHAIVDGTERTVSKLTTNYKLIEVIMEQMLSGSKDENIEFLWFLGDSIEAYGLNFLNDEEHQENFLRKVTGADGFLPVKVARTVVKNYSMTLFSDVAKNLNVYVIFEDGNAVPKYYVQGYVREVFNWPILEDDYKSTIVNNPNVDMDLLIMSWGPPYVKKESWTVMDKSFNKVGTFSSLEEVKKKFGIIY